MLRIYVNLYVNIQDSYKYTKIYANKQTCTQTHFSIIGCNTTLLINIKESHLAESISRRYLIQYLPTHSL